jgi:hypothetical protein
MTTALNERAGFLQAYPGYRSTALLDRLRATEYSYLDEGGHVYLDYTGAGLPAQAQLNAHAERMRGRRFGEFARSHGATTRYVPFCPADLRVDDDAIRQALAGPQPGWRSAAGRVVRPGMAPRAGWGLRGRRQRLLDRGGPANADRPAAAQSGAAAPCRRGLFAHPAQSNFSGVQHPCAG